MPSDSRRFLKGSIGDCRFPIADFRFISSVPRFQSAIGNWQSAIKMSRAKHRGTSRVVEVFRVRFSRPELFSWLFYVAASRLNSPRFSAVLIRCLKSHCQETTPNPSVLTVRIFFCVFSSSVVRRHFSATRRHRGCTENRIPNCPVSCLMMTGLSNRPALPDRFKYNKINSLWELEGQPR
jgi:hypothetical protein